MIKDVAAKLLLIPLLGILIPLLTRFISYSNRNPIEIIGSELTYIFLTYLLWQAVVTITAFIRNKLRIQPKGILKILLLIGCSTLFSFIVVSLFTQFMKTNFSGAIHYKNSVGYVFSYVALAPVISLSYEILFLKKEQELDSKIVKQLDFERQSAELNALKAELDPHFIFNSLNALVPLIASDASKAYVFTTKLAQVYKYLLVNKDRELITLGEELNFIEDYFFLLQIRHENKLKLQTHLDVVTQRQVLILPFALQVLVENAIKHNQFSVDAPLKIQISLSQQSIQVSNTTQAKFDAVESTNIGLKNLSSRYKLTCNKDISIYHTKDQFIVKLPLIKTTV